MAHPDPPVFIFDFITNVPTRATVVEDGGSNDTESADLSDRRVWDVPVSRYSWNPPQVADVGGLVGLGFVGFGGLGRLPRTQPRVLTTIRSRNYLKRSF